MSSYTNRNFSLRFGGSTSAVVADAIYYFDATNGLDTNTGKTTADPLKTISKLNSMTFLPGEQILFKRGETFAGKIIPPSCGTASKKISFNAYGEGAAPVINGTGQSSALAIDNTKYHLEFHNIKFSGNTSTTDAVCKVYTHDVLMEDCEIMGANAYHGYSAWADQEDIYNLVVRRCSIHDNYRVGLFMGAGGATYVPKNCLVENCTAFANGHSNSLDHGIYVGFGVTVRGCECYNNFSAGIKANNSDGLINNNFLTVFENNKTHNNYYGIFLGATGVTVRNNLIYNNTKNNLYLDAQGLGCSIFHNTISNAYSDFGIKFGADVVGAGNTFKNNIVYQDKFSVNGVQTCLGSYVGGYSTVSANNTFDYNCYYYDGNVATAIFGSNTFAAWKALAGSPDAHSLLAEPLYADKSTLATTVNASSATGQKVLIVASTTGYAVGDVLILDEGGASQRAAVIASIQAGVSLTMTANLNYTYAIGKTVAKRLYPSYVITTTSPCKNAGVSVGVATDYLGVTRDATPDIGAYEFV